MRKEPRKRRPNKLFKVTVTLPDGTSFENIVVGTTPSRALTHWEKDRKLSYASLKITSMENDKNIHIDERREEGKKNRKF